MEIAQSSLFQMRESLRQTKSKEALNRIPSGKGTLFRRVGTLYKALLRERYGVSRFDVLIAGPDTLLNLILAFRAVSAGKSVAIYHGDDHSWDMTKDLYRIRFNAHERSFTEMIEELLGFTDMGGDEGVFREHFISSIRDRQEQYDTLLQEIGFHTDRLWAKGVSYLLSGCSLINDPIEHVSDSHRFIVEESQDSQSYPAIERMVFWPQSWQERFAALRYRKPSHVLEAKEIWWTGIPVVLAFEEGEKGLRQRFYGEARWPLSSFAHFQSNDRMKDILHAIKDAQEL